MRKLPLFFGLPFLTLPCLAAQPPQWIEATVPPPTGQPAVFARSFDLPQAPALAKIRVNANSRVYPPYEQPLLIPAPPTAVYDHLAGPELLRGVDTIFLCGIAVSEPTLAAVQERVKQGARCFAPARLCPESVRKQAAALPARVDAGSGAWIVLAGFQPKDLGSFAPLLPQRTFRRAASKQPLLAGTGLSVDLFQL